MDINQVVTTSSNRDFVRNKNVIVGTSRKVDGDIYLATPNMSIARTSVSYIPSLFKILDEIIVNSVDHFINCILKSTIQHKCKFDNSVRHVTIIRVSIDGDAFAILNDGYGIPITKVEQYGKYLPEVLFTEEKTGTNMGNDASRITGGTNGTGATTICAFSKHVNLCINDKSYKYSQTAKLVGTGKNAELKFGAPKITANDTGSQFTNVSFAIDWASTEYKTFSKNVKSLFTNYIFKRLIQTSLYVRHVVETATVIGTKPPLPLIMFNDIKIDIDHNNESIINNTFGLIKSFMVKLVAKKQPANPLSAQFTLIVGINQLDGPGYKEISVINGVEVLSNPITELVKGIITKEVKIYCEQNKMTTGNTKAKNYITIVLVGCIPDPQWVGQVKEGVTLNKDFVANYDIREKCDTIKASLAKIVYEIITNDRLKKKKTQNKNILKESDLYIRSLSVVNGRRSGHTFNRLFICEGSSAMTLISNILDKKRLLNSSNTGRLSTGGVINNVFHKMNWYSNDNFEFIKLTPQEKVKCRLIYGEQIENSKFVQTFIAATGLSEDKVDDKTLLAKLNYDEIICSTDPDYDGWNITGLLIVLLSKWTALLTAGRMKILHLPIIRIIPRDLEERTKKAQGKNKRALSDEFINSVTYWEFHSQRDYEEFITTNEVPSTHFVKYYKGLATIEDFFDNVIARDVEKYIYTLYWDDNAARNLELYYGKTRVDTINGECVITKMSDERKRILAEPIRKMSSAERKLYDMKYITVSTFLEIYVKEYFLDNLHRKLLKVMDGKNNVGSKITYALPEIFRPNCERRVSEVGPQVGTISVYHHGEDSINRSVQNSGQQFPGKVMFPLLVTSGKWGSRDDGGDFGQQCSAGAPRYINCKLNKKFYDLLYRAEDSIILDYQEDEGRPTEPKYMLPVFPTIAIENYATTAHGWKITMWSRSYHSVAAYLFMLVKYHRENKSEEIRKILNAWVLEMEPRNYDIKPIRFHSDEDEFFLSKGACTLVQGESDRIMVTALPIGVWTRTYVRSIENKIGTKEKQGSLYGIVKSIESFSKETIDICITMEEGWAAKALNLTEQDKSFYDGELSQLEKLLHLYAKISDEINVIDEYGRVKVFRNHIELVNYWFDLRIRYYVKRVGRMIENLKLKVLREEQKITYLKRFPEFKLSGKLDDDFDATLDAAGFTRFRNISGKLKFNIVPNDKIMKFATCEITDEEDLTLLHNLVCGGVMDRNLTFNYLRDLRTGATSAKGIEKVEAKLAKVKAKVAELQVQNIEYTLFERELRELNVFVNKEFFDV
jgi:DNA topoisomerase-2